MKEKGRDWAWREAAPADWRPCVRRGEVEFFTHSGLGMEGIYRHRDIYGEGYLFEAETQVIAAGGGGYVF